MDFGTNLRNIRIQRGLTQQKLANDMGISQASITAYENQVREPTFETVRRFAEYFHVAPSVLMPFGEYSADEQIQRMSEVIYQNQKLRLLFDLTKNFSDSDLDVVINVANAIRGRETT